VVHPRQHPVELEAEMLNAAIGWYARLEQSSHPLCCANGGTVGTGTAAHGAWHFVAFHYHQEKEKEDGTEESF
jgi:hypothetical protein